MAIAMDNPSLSKLVSSDAFYDQVLSRLVDPNETYVGGITLLHIAALSNQENSKILRLLLDRGADVDAATTPGGTTPLHLAVVNRKRDAVAILTDAGASVNSEDISGRTSLHLAITKRWFDCPGGIDVDCDMWILDHPGVNLNALYGGRETPLMLGVREQNPDVVKLLLRKGADIDFPNKYNQTPLHVAVQDPDPSYEIVKSLLMDGADIYSKDNRRHTPMDVLIQHVLDENALTFASRCVWLVAFQYHIRDPLRRTLGRIPLLFSFLDECCKELELMKRKIVHNHFTLYDLAQGCLEVRTAPTMVVEILLSGMFRKYFEFILCRLSREDLRGVLEKTCGRRTAQIRQDASSIALYHEIARCYKENEVLKNRARKVKEYIMNQEVTLFQEKLEKCALGFEIFNRVRN